MASALNPVELRKNFELAAKFVRNKVGELSSEQLLQFYGIYKQSTEGPCTTAKPGFFDFQAKEKWSAWKKLCEMSSIDAMTKYIALVSQIDENWLLAAQTQTEKGFSVAVSTLNGHEEDQIPENRKTIFDWTRENNVVRLKEALLGSTADVDSKDETGMTSLHWASDRGLINVVKCLVENGAKVNVQDGDGQTPLHFASSCGHVEIVKFLISNGADPDLTDNEGISAKDAAMNNDILTLF